MCDLLLGLGLQFSVTKINIHSRTGSQILLVFKPEIPDLLTYYSVSRSLLMHYNFLLVL